MRSWVVLLVFAFSANCAVPDVQGLEERVRQLERLVESLQHRLDAVESLRPVAQKAQLAAVPAAAAVPVEAPAPPVRPRVAFGGEFRLYFDSLTRPAGGGAPRVSNNRGRYLLHLDADAELHPTLSVHARLSTGPLNNPLTDIQDFGGGVAKQPFFLSEAYADYHPNETIRLQGGRVDNPFNDRTRFLFDMDTRFNGTNEIFRFKMPENRVGVSEVRLLAGQYTFTNPSFATIAPGTPSTASTATPSEALLAAGAEPGSIPRSSQLFQQGLIARQEKGPLTQELQGDLQFYRNPNQLRLLSTPAGAYLFGTSLGLAPTGGTVPSPSNATTTPNGATLTAGAFRIAHVSYTLGLPEFATGRRRMPLSLNLQWARNIEHVSDRNAWSAIASAGSSRETGDIRLLYGFYRKEANSLIGELTENDIAIGGNVNMTAHIVRLEYTFHPHVLFANNFIWSTWLKDSNPQAQSYVPLGVSVPRQIRYQSMLIFRF